MFLFFFGLLGFSFRLLADEPSTDPPSRTPMPTSKSGVPSKVAVICSVLAAILTILCTVSILCIVSRKRREPKGYQQPLIEKSLI
ncbi:hypothetical protein TVAG_439210 [Trichomonas vaginalis G3]|uniref:Uncharacterized protein n=1 Tax=Trichomonas vaginalis (strain ATCC PRA-98 / G3) TaxID=412133 RepID=A2FQY8_TRIV3|nr:hypothetical protein TVAGG3_0236110 [Trichomonas vaginalis G3]EAX92693.1 hypothetical protein TVAG_439210 [Trichomonas vaginalis G3]KAI5553006.1 hypothetical protein TVAGG3_0236110 [Trichomonas vaginalis G3]|eukprot:XP_001305623.1 hypothetical protein [Trichomonas vaginalis G3]